MANYLRPRRDLLACYCTAICIPLFSLRYDLGDSPGVTPLPHWVPNMSSAPQEDRSRNIESSGNLWFGDILRTWPIVSRRMLCAILG